MYSARNRSKDEVRDALRRRDPSRLSLHHAAEHNQPRARQGSIVLTKLTQDRATSVLPRLSLPPSPAESPVRVSLAYCIRDTLLGRDSRPSPWRFLSWTASLGMP